MNKILTHQGGQPLYLDDVAFVDNAVRESFSGILSMFGASQNIYLTDLNITRGEIAQGVQTVRWNSGYIALGGEVLAVAAGNIAVNPALPRYWHVVTSAGENSNRVFEDGIARDCLQVRRAVLSTVSKGGFLEADVKSVRGAMTSMLANDFRSRIVWRVLSTDSGYTDMESKLELGYDGQCYYLRGVYKAGQDITLARSTTQISRFLLEKSDIALTEQEALGLRQSSIAPGVATFVVSFRNNYNPSGGVEFPRNFGLSFDVGQSGCSLYIGENVKIVDLSQYAPKIPFGHSCAFFITLN